MVNRIHASIYPLESSIYIPTFQRAEKMFASDKGPLFGKTGPSTVNVKVTGEEITESMEGWEMVVYFYEADTLEDLERVQEDLVLFSCSKHSSLDLEGMQDVKKLTFTVENETLEAEATYYVKKAGWIDTEIFLCYDGARTLESMDFTGTLTVMNPYGYLPAVLYGLLPFNGFLAVGYAALDIFFVFLVFKYSSQALRLHYGILFITILGTVGSGTWFGAFYSLNESGDPVAYPYPPLFTAAIVLDTLMKTLARVTLLVVCMGYGTVRPSLQRSETVIVSILAFGYLVAGIGDQINQETSNGSDFGRKPTLWAFLQLVCNLAFIMWIQVSLESIIKELRTQQQSAKLSMYKQLAWTLASFVVFFTVLTTIVVLSHFGVFEWSVQWEWIQLVAWPVLNFIVCLAMCIIWRPTSTSSQYAYSTQLPTSDSPGDVELANKPDRPTFSIASDEEDDEITIELDIDEPREKKEEGVKAEKKD